MKWASNRLREGAARKPGGRSDTVLSSGDFFRESSTKRAKFRRTLTHRAEGDLLLLPGSKKKEAQPLFAKKIALPKEGETKTTRKDRLKLKLKLNPSFPNSLHSLCVITFDIESFQPRNDIPQRSIPLQ